MQVYCTPLEFSKTFQSLAGNILRRSWWKKPHGYHTVSCAMCILVLTLRRDLYLPQKLYPEELRSKARLNLATYLPGYEMKMAVQEFHRLHEPNINKLNGGYSVTANLLFQSWLKDIKVHLV